MSAKSPKKWNCLEEIRKEIKEKEKVEKAIRIVSFLQRGKSEKVVSAEWKWVLVFFRMTHEAGCFYSLVHTACGF